MCSRSDIVFLTLVIASGISAPAKAAEEIPGLSNLSIAVDAETTPSIDFLIDATPFKTTLSRDEESATISLSNGLIRRSWCVRPNGACISFENLMTGNAILRAVRPEARVTIDGKALDVGGLVGQPNQAFLTDAWLREMKSDPNSLRLVAVRSTEPAERIAWKQRRHHAPHSNWPPKGKRLTMDFRADTPNPKCTVSVNYEMYDGIPAMSKWITVKNETTKTVTIDRFRGEELAVVEHTNWVEKRDTVQLPQPKYLHVETDFAFGGFNPENANRHTVRWAEDPDFTTQVNYLKKTPCLLIVEPTYGPAQKIAPGESFMGFRTFELVYDDGNRERRGLTLRKMYRTLAPWITENPITHHLLSSDPVKVREAIDQAAEVGFEAIIMSFGSGFNMESTDADYLATWKSVADYAESKNIELGSYSLFSSRSVGGGNDVVSPEGQMPAFGQAPAATSEWGIDYFEKLKRFFDTTGFDQFENDGPYPGDLDVTPRPPLQLGVNDSRWAQWKIVAGLFKHLRASGVYINQPDYYFFMGGNKTGMGYREVNWSLPRAQQIIHTRQNIYDGTWTKPPSMGWMHVPLSQYHGGGAAATIEPLDEHLDHYERIMLCNLGLGVQAHYRGPRLFDTNRTKSKVAETVAWFKKYRDILESDVIHGRRADGRDVDWMLHANPLLENKGMLCVYNPLKSAVERRITVNLYYTGLTDVAKIWDQNDSEIEAKLDRRFRANLDVTIPAEGMSWYLIR